MRRAEGSAFFWKGPSRLVAAGAKTIGSRSGGMFRLAAADPFAPHPKRRGFHLRAHELNHLWLRQTELVCNGLEGRSVLPGHFNHPVEIFGLQNSQVGQHETCLF